jgi:hypothetical protein
VTCSHPGLITLENGGVAMLVITRYRPVSPIDLPALVAAVQAVSKLMKPIAGTKLPSLYFNECGCEVVIISKINNFADLDTHEADVLNNKIGLILIKAGLILASVDYLREFPGPLHEHAKLFESLGVAKQ